MPACLADLRESDFSHAAAHGGNNPVKCRAVIAIFIAQAQDRNTIADAFIHQVLGAIARRMRPVNIAGLVMGAFMPVDKALKFRRSGGEIRSKNNRIAIPVPGGHGGGQIGTAPAAIDKADRLPFVIGARRRSDDIERRRRLFVLPHGGGGNEHAQCQTGNNGS